MYASLNSSSIQEAPRAKYQQHERSSVTLGVNVGPDTALEFPALSYARIKKRYDLPTVSR